MLSHKCADSLKFQNQLPVYHQVGKILSKKIPVFIPNLKPLLRLNIVSCFSQSMSQTVLIHLLKISIAKIDMDTIGDLPDIFHQLIYAHFLHLSTSTRQSPYPTSPPLHGNPHTPPLHLYTAQDITRSPYSRS